MKTKLLVLAIVCALAGCAGTIKNPNTNSIESARKKELLLIGTFHYNNPGADVAKTKSFDVLSANSQFELKRISRNIKNYKPTKIFVEWPYDEQEELNALYQLYLNDQYFTDETLSTFQRQNEIFQLAFRVARYSGLKTVYAIDYKTPFPFEDVLKAIEKNNQPELKAQILDGISTFTSEFDEKIAAGTSLTELTYFLNSSRMRNFSNNFHNNLMLLAGEPTDFSGPLLTSEWYKRNLYMWSLIQKHTEQADERVMVLVGASHAAMLELFIAGNGNWQIKELRNVMSE